VPRHVCVAGASGFLGRRLVAALAAAGVPTTAASRGAPTDGPGVRPLRVRSYADLPGGDVLVHLAETRDLHAVAADEERHRADARGLLAALLDGRYRRVVYASSGVVHGDGGDRPRRPDEPPEARGAYARMKLDGEAAVLAAGGTVVRLANLYGPGMAPDSAVAEILAQVRGEGPLRIRDGAPVRDWLWIGDAADALARVAADPAPGVFNLGTGRGVAVAEVARAALRAAGREDRGVEETAPSARASALVLDPSALSARWGWRPATPLEDGLAMLIKPAP